MWIPTCARHNKDLRNRTCTLLPMSTGNITALMYKLVKYRSMQSIFSLFRMPSTANRLVYAASRRLQSLPLARHVALKAPAQSLPSARRRHSWYVSHTLLLTLDHPAHMDRGRTDGAVVVKGREITARTKISLGPAPSTSCMNVVPESERVCPGRERRRQHMPSRPSHPLVFRTC